MMMMMMMMMRRRRRRRRKRSRRRSNCFYRMIYYWKALRIISNQDHCRGFSLWQASDMPQSGSEPSKNLSSEFGEGTYAVVITITPRHHNTQLGIKLIKMKNLFQLASVIGYLQERWCFFTVNSLYKISRQVLDHVMLFVSCIRFLLEKEIWEVRLWVDETVICLVFEACMFVVSSQCW